MYFLEVIYVSPFFISFLLFLQSSSTMIKGTHIATTTRFFTSPNEKEFLIVNAVGPDRLGIVSNLTQLVVEKGGNVGESQATRLGSHFGLMMLVSVPKTNSQILQNAVQNVEGMSTTCFVTDDPNAIAVAPQVGCTLNVSFALIID